MRVPWDKDYAKYGPAKPDSIFTLSKKKPRMHFFGFSRFSKQIKTQLKREKNPPSISTPNGDQWTFELLVKN